MEQNVDTGAQMTPVIDNKQKSGNGLKIATAIACIVAVCGIGFGVYGMIQSSQKDSQISDLKVQIKENDETITTIKTPEIETSANDGTVATIIDTIVDGNSKDYIYIGEWGVKIKIPESLIGKVGYIFSSNDYFDYLEITDYASAYSYGQQMDWNSNNLLQIVRSKAGEIDFENCRTSCSALITTLNGYDYSYVLSGNNLELLQSTALNEMTKEDAFSEF